MPTATQNRISENGQAKGAHVTIAEPNFQIGVFQIVGASPYVQEKFSQKARDQMKAKQEAGSTAKKGSKREAKDFQECFEQAQYKDEKGRNGIPAGAIRSAMISACRLCGFQMTRAKLALLVLADTNDASDGIPLIFINGKPEYFEQPLKNETGVADIRVRPMWREWSAEVRIQFDADVLTIQDVANLLMRAGMQVGIGAGRPDSRKSTGVGWGLFNIAEK